MPTPEAKKASYHHGDLREALIGAGLAILAEGGDPAALSLREAARRAGVSAMAPYRHFADKDALLAAVAAIGFSRLTTALTEADAHEDRLEALIRQGVAYVTFACAEPALFRLMFGSTIGEKRGDLATVAAAAYAMLAERIRSLVAPAEAEIWALRCWATVHGLAALAVDGQLANRGIEPTALADRVLRLPGSMPGF